MKCSPMRQQSASVRLGFHDRPVRYSIRPWRRRSMVTIPGYGESPAFAGLGIGY